MNSALTVTETTETREYWATQGLGNKHQQQIDAADVLIVPEKNFREEVPFVFHHDTTSLYHFLAERLDQSLSIELYADDDEYLEISLHSATFRISTIIVSYVAAPLVVGLLTNYLYDQLKAKPTDKVEASLVIEDHQCRAFKFEFNGEAKDFNALSDKVGELAEKCMAVSGKNGKGKK